jgi:hypothetical protein
MAGKGGYQRPTSPAPVSGPGALAQRTDGGPGSKQAMRYVSGLPYGEGQQMMNTQASAPMEAETPTAALSPSAIASASQTPAQTQEQAPQAQVIPFSAPTMNPNEPVTHGANAGPGGDLNSLGLPNPDVNNYQNAKSMLGALASSHDASPALKFLAQRINGVF